MVHVLVIANETAASPTLLDALRERAEQADVTVTVIEPRQRYVDEIIVSTAAVSERAVVSEGAR